MRQQGPNSLERSAPVHCPRELIGKLPEPLDGQHTHRGHADKYRARGEGLPDDRRLSQKTIAVALLS